ncbi:aminotransferase class IV [uncultured Amnibacterium sp.]|uniref:aminotransferase class IV n=1 Tax=uncultured Amnibacterium sp. TaxID=1631851 RepID=UPI0035CA9672
MPSRVVALFEPVGVPHARLVSPGSPVVLASDLGATRGDGVFETIGVVAGRPQALRLHLDRFARSARLLELPDPDRRAWTKAIREVVAALPPTGEAFVKIVLTRGDEGGDGTPTGWLLGAPAPDHTNARTEGIGVVLLEAGRSAGTAQQAPWLLLGAKTLSYAANRAMLREAQRRGADDALLLSTDGLLLEGPTSTVVLRTGDRLRTTPPEFGVLPGTTQADVFRFAATRGFTCAVEPLTTADLQRADAAWLASSGRLMAPIRAVDDTPRPIDAPLTADLNAWLLARLK